MSESMKNTDRVGQLAKAAAMRILPAAQYASGSARKIAEEAIKKMKAPRGLNGADVSTKSSKFFKEASEKSKEVATGAAVTAGAAAAGALAGRAVGRKALGAAATDHAAAARTRSASKAWDRGAVPNTLRTARVGARAEKQVLSTKNLRAAGRKGGKIGALVGATAALGSLARSKMEKKAARAVVPHKGAHLLPKGAAIPAGAKDVSPKAILKGRVNKAGRVGVAVAAAATLAAGAKKHLEKKASRKDGKGHLSVGGAAVAGAGYAAGRRLKKDGIKMTEGLKAQAKYIQSKGKSINQMDVRMALDSFRKPIARRAAKAAVKGGALAGVAAAGLNKLMDNHKAKARKAARMQKQAETVGSQGSREMKKVVKSQGKKGSMALQPGADKKPVKKPVKGKNPLLKQAAEMITRNGVKHRKGTANSAAATFGAVNAGMALGNNIVARSAANKFGGPAAEIIGRNALTHGVPRAAVTGAVAGYLYGKVRGHFRKKRGEQDTPHAEFAKLKKG